MKKPIMNIITRTVHLKNIFVHVPSNKSGHVTKVHYFEKPIHFLLLVSTDFLYVPSSEFSLALHNKLQSLTATRQSTLVDTVL